MLTRGQPALAVESCRGPEIIELEDLVRKAAHRHEEEDQSEEVWRQLSPALIGALGTLAGHIAVAFCSLVKGCLCSRRQDERESAEGASLATIGRARRRGGGVLR